MSLFRSQGLQCLLWGTNPLLLREALCDLSQLWAAVLQVELLARARCASPTGFDVALLSFVAEQLFREFPGLSQKELLNIRGSYIFGTSVNSGSSYNSILDAPLPPPATSVLLPLSPTPLILFSYLSPDHFITSYWPPYLFKHPPLSTK